MNKTRCALLLVAFLVLMVSLPATAQEASGNAFPVTIEHKFGSITLNEAPQRVVSIGFSEQDPLLALGVTPIAVRYWYGDATNAIFPWAQDEAAGAEPVVLNMEFGALNYETILELDPDLIVAVYSGITEDEYIALSQIAPTLAQTAEFVDFGMSWQETTRLIARAVGKSAEAEALIGETESLVVNARAANPEFEGKSIAVVYGYEAGLYGYYTAQDPRGRFFTDLGFVIPEDMLELAGESYYADISTERIDLLDRDLIVFVGLQFIEGGLEEINSDPLFSQLNAVREGRVVFVPDEFDDALQFNTILSVPYLIEGILPELQAALGVSAAEATATPDTETAAVTDECEPGFRLFDHELLATDPVCIPENPQRIVALDLTAAELLLFTDKTLVGTFDWILLDLGVTMPALEDELAETTVIGWPANLETILELSPDMIVSYEDESLVYDELSAIAPTVTLSAVLGDWTVSTGFWAEVFNVQDVFAEMLETYHARVEELQAALGDERDQLEVSVIHSSPYFTWFPLPDSPQGILLSGVGLGRPAAQSYTGEEAVAQYGNSGTIVISDEALDLADGDVILLFSYANDDPEIMQENQDHLDMLQSNPLWQSLSAVQEDHVYLVGPHWYRAATYLVVNLMIDDLFTYLTDVEPTTPNPIEVFADATPEASG